jgi:hypothetical protein
MQWTPGARAAVNHARIRSSDDVVDRAITHAEQLAAQRGATVVDTDLWLQSYIYVRRTQRLKPPPKDG